MPRFTSENQYAQEGEAGARTMERIRENNNEQQARALQAQREARLQELERWRMKVEQAKEDRAFATAQAAAAQRLTYEDRLAKAIPKLYAIDPSAKDAEKRRADLASQYPDLLHTDKKLPSMLSQFEAHGKLVEEAAKQRGASKSKLDAIQAAEDNFRNDIANPPEGFSTTKATHGGVTFEKSQPPGALKPAELTKLQNEFEKRYAGYDGRLSSLSDMNPGDKANAPFIFGKNRDRQLMQDAARKLKKANPEMADEIDQKVNEALTHEHDLLQKNLESKTGTDTATSDQKKLLIAEINPIKKTLGYQTLDQNGVAIPGTEPPDFPKPKAAATIKGGETPTPNTPSSTAAPETSVSATTTPTAAAPESPDVIADENIPVTQPDAPVNPNINPVDAEPNATETPSPQPTPAVVPAPVTTVTPVEDQPADPTQPDHAKAIEWAKSNPDHPLSKRILKANGL